MEDQALLSGNEGTEGKKHVGAEHRMLAQKLLMWTLVRRSAPKRSRRDNTFQDPVLATTTL